MYTIEEERFQSSTKSNCWFCSSPFSWQLVPRSLTLIFLMRTSYVDSLTAVPDLVNAAEEISKVPFSCNRPRFLTDTATHTELHTGNIYFSIWLTIQTSKTLLRRLIRHANLLTLNSPKTEFLLIGLQQQLTKIHNCSCTQYHWFSSEPWFHLRQSSHFLRPNIISL